MDNRIREHRFKEYIAGLLQNAKLYRYEKLCGSIEILGLNSNGEKGLTRKYGFKLLDRRVYPDIVGYIHLTTPFAVYEPEDEKPNLLIELVSKNDTKNMFETYLQAFKYKGVYALEDLFERRPKVLVLVGYEENVDFLLSKSMAPHYFFERLLWHSGMGMIYTYKGRLMISLSEQEKFVVKGGVTDEVLKRIGFD